jgi:hypothetical protein
MGRITYGISAPKDLLGKLSFDGEKIEGKPHPYDVFNFFITASVLYDWVGKHYKNELVVQKICAAVKNENPESIPDESKSWLIDDKCLPNNGCDPRRHILNAINICWQTANSSKHYYWHSTSDVTAIEEEPVIKDFYQYFFTSVEPGLYIEFSGEYYTLAQVKGILTQFYTGLINLLEKE